ENRFSFESLCGDLQNINSSWKTGKIHACVAVWVHHLATVAFSGQVIYVDGHFGLYGGFNLKEVGRRVRIKPDATANDVIVDTNDGSRISFSRSRGRRAAAGDLVRLQGAHPAGCNAPPNASLSPSLFRRSRSGHVPRMPAARL